MKEPVFGLIIEFNAQLLKADDMGVQPSPADLVPPRLWDIGFTVSGKHRAGQHHRTAQLAALTTKIVASQVVDIDLAGLENTGVAGNAIRLYSHFPEQFDQEVDVEDVGDIGDRHSFGGQQYGADNL